MATKRPTLVLLAGPNGAGKSTLYETRVKPVLNVPFINADIIQREELAKSDMNASYEAARIAEDRRRQHLAEGSSFATETVFSHPSKLDLLNDAKTRGFRLMVFHISLEDADLSIARVGERVAEGGHNVPVEKIRARYARNGALIRQAVLMADIGHVFDNSLHNQPLIHLISFERGRCIERVEKLPKWAAVLYGGEQT